MYRVPVYYARDFFTYDDLRTPVEDAPVVSRVFDVDVDFSERVRVFGRALCCDAGGTECDRRGEFSHGEVCMKSR